MGILSIKKSMKILSVVFIAILPYVAVSDNNVIFFDGEIRFKD